MSTPFAIILLILVVIGFATVILVILKKTGKDTGADEKLKQVHEEMEKIKEEMKGSLEKNLDFLQKQSAATAGMMQRQTTDTAKIVQEVTSKLEKLEATNKQVVGFTDQLQNLERVLTSSKNRGSLGEASLELILSNILPPQAYEMQYKFENGETVDAVVKIKNKILSVDAKFSLDNYRRILSEVNEEKKRELEKEFKNDLKKRIDETAKYIRPNEDTLDFAFMFIPAEGIYYDLLINEVGAVKVDTGGLIDYAFKEKKVIIVSPTTFAAYLQTVLQGLRALQIEESAKEIRKRVEELGRHILSYDEYMKKLGNNLGTVVNSYNTAYKELNKIDKDVVKITEGEKKIEPLILDKPQSE
ncbi:DNA recombination protein RmuC [Candidatus Kuenenbacteria bacterium CG23_combo_of_CG06-09_8_20_14_all_36_9]|uniref:DNA recombination protein RmuC n=1 Tax=Candidatus Kuenenbacteria bacterium CG10_big_fil_rev_8_21_14_0_10_36_11 TaxID=1974618 RepID=A0A2M6WAD2_9BACT|nr:MAG: DNA recombination protein RmuC [Candidatus Kuenenbacteria bacterium CG23_combo_of_CG06-09_8_20_14_all_36_9]PIT89760.1 MAG: DNA recombination protein RmuC [Candidatus Kuenenbacteria bacterium CG10_big_fil_rev_8_21_14_0_10_36_11]